MLRAVTLRQIEGFLLAAAALSFTRAAEGMHISQSAFSQLIRELESALGVRLFDRTTRRVVLTDAGVALQRKMKRGMADIDDACREARAIARVEHGHLTVGTLASLAIGMVTRALAKLRVASPGVRVSMREDFNGALIEHVAAGEVDLAICAHTTAVEGLHFEPLFDDELVAVFQRSSRLGRKQALDWMSIGEERLVLTTRASSTHEQVAAALRAHGLPAEPDYDVANMFTALSMVRAGFGVTFLPLTVLKEVSTKGLAWRRMEGRPPLRRIGICRRPELTPSPAAARFEALMRAEVDVSTGRD